MRQFLFVRICIISALCSFIVLIGYNIFKIIDKINVDVRHLYDTSLLVTHYHLVNISFIALIPLAAYLVVSLRVYKNKILAYLFILLLVLNTIPLIPVMIIYYNIHLMNDVSFVMYFLGLVLCSICALFSTIAFSIMIRYDNIMIVMAIVTFISGIVTFHYFPRSTFLGYSLTIISDGVAVLYFIRALRRLGLNKFNAACEEGK